MCGRSRETVVKCKPCSWNAKYKMMCLFVRWWLLLLKVMLWWSGPKMGKLRWSTWIKVNLIKLSSVVRIIWSKCYLSREIPSHVIYVFYLDYPLIIAWPYKDNKLFIVNSESSAVSTKTCNTYLEFGCGVSPKSFFTQKGGNIVCVSHSEQAK